MNLNDLDLELITRYLGGLATEAEHQRVVRWLAESPEHGMLLEALREMGASGDAPAPPEWKAAVAASLRRLQDDGPLPERPGGRRLDVVRGGGGPRPRFIVWPTRDLPVLAKAMLAAIVVAGAAVAGRLMLRPTTAPAPPPDRVFTAARAQQIQLRLPDGTLIKLAPASTLRIPADYGVAGRGVTLDGEAAFTVAHDATRPFAVRTARTVTRDLGTRFVVRAYPGDPATDVVVAEGRVAVGRTAATSDAHILGRGARARVMDDGPVVVTPRVALDPYFAWTEGRLVFYATPLREAAAQLARWYDIDVRLSSDAIGGRTVTASLRDEPAPDVLALIAATLQLELARDGRVYTLSPKQGRI